MSALIFVEPTKSERALQVLRQALGAKRLEYLLALLAFILGALAFKRNSDRIPFYV